MNRLLACTGALALAFSAHAASAADMPRPMTKAPAMVAAPMFDWSGFYVGVHGGYAWGDYRLFSASGGGPTVDVDGFVGGGTIGWNWQHSNWVFGIEADISNGPDGTDNSSFSPFWGCNTGRCNVDIDYFGTVRARLGIAVNQWMGYVTGGYAYGHAEGGIRNSVQQGSGSVDGWAAGVGIEYAFAPNWSMKLEYLHVDLGDLEFGTGVGTERFLGDGDFDVVRVGLNYRFAAGGKAPIATAPAVVTKY